MVATSNRVLVGGIGHDNLRDLAVGRLVISRLRGERWPEGVVIEDLSIGAVLAHHWLQQYHSFQAAVLISAESRGGPPGTIRCYSWHPLDTTADTVQTHVAEAMTGLVSLATFLTVVSAFGTLPPRVRIVEIEPRDCVWGEELSPPMNTALPKLFAVVRQQVEELLS